MSHHANILESKIWVKIKEMNANSETLYKWLFGLLLPGHYRNNIQQPAWANTSDLRCLTLIFEGQTCKLNMLSQAPSSTSFFPLCLCCLGKYLVIIWSAATKANTYIRFTWQSITASLCSQNHLMNSERNHCTLAWNPLTRHLKWYLELYKRSHSLELRFIMSAYLFRRKYVSLMLE